MEPDLIERSVEKTNAWLKEVAAELGVEDRRYSLRVLRAFLHTLRDHLAVDEAAQLAAQLPVLLRGIYYEGWDPSRTPTRYRHPDEFLARVAREGRLAGTTEASHAVAAAGRVLRSHISGGELGDVLAALPGPIRTLLEPALA